MNTLKFTFLFTVILLFLFKNSPTQVSPVWQVSFNDSVSESNYAVKSKTDNEYNIIVLARGTNSSLGSGVDFILIKYNSQGEKLWNRRFDGTGHSSDYPADMVIDRNNNIYITGRSWGDSTKNDYLTLKYSPGGDLLWVRRFNWLVSRNDEAYAIALDSNDNVYVTGLATGAYDGHELYDMVTVKYNSEGEQKWIKSFEGYLEIADWGYSVVCDLRGNIYVSGFTLSASFLNTDIISIKYDSLGNEIWQRRFDNKGDDYIRPLFSRVDGNDNLIVASYFKGDTTRMDYLTFKYDSTGSLQWSKMYDGGVRNIDWVHDLSIDKYGNVIVTGSSVGMGANYDFLTLKYSSSGNELWQSRINDSTGIQGTSSDHAESILLDRNGNIMVYGWSTFFQDYSVVLIYDFNGNLNSKFRNFSMRTALSINSAGNNDFAVTGYTDPKTFTARYQNIITGVIPENILYSNRFSLYQNYPNPFNPITNIKYEMAYNGLVSIRVYDVLGNEVRVLLNEKRNQGSYQTDFDGSDLPSGIYFYSLTIDNNLIETKKMLLIK